MASGAAAAAGAKEDPHPLPLLLQKVLEIMYENTNRSPVEYVDAENRRLLKCAAANSRLSSLCSHVLFSVTIRAVVVELLSPGASGTINEQQLSAARSAARNVMLAEQTNTPAADSFLELTPLADGADGLDV